MSKESVSILVIEDHEAVRENIAETLELSGYETLTAPDGNVGVRLAKEHRPDLILCDVMMPELDGFGVLQILSRQELTSGIPFIFLTARGEKADFRRGMELGADDYLTKPFGKDELLLAIETRLKKYERLSKEDKSSTKTLLDLEKGRQALEALFAKTEKRVLNKKGSLFEEGQRPRHIYQLIKGRVKLSRDSDLGKALIIDLRGPTHRSQAPNPFVGYRAMLQNEVHGCNAIALDDEVEYHRISASQFNEEIRKDQNLAAYLNRLVSDDLTHTKIRMMSLAYQSVRKRTAEAIVWLHDTVEAPEKGNSIPREDLAQMVGTATESVIRMLREFRDDGYITQEKGRIIVLDRESLSEMPA